LAPNIETIFPTRKLKGAPIYNEIIPKKYTIPIKARFDTSIPSLIVRRIKISLNNQIAEPNIAKMAYVCFLI